MAVFKLCCNDSMVILMDKTGLENAEDIPLGTTIPLIPGNRAYEIYKAWVDDGNTPEPEYTPEEIEQQDLDIAKDTAKIFLAESDIFIQRYRDDLACGRTPFMPEAKYFNLLKKRARAQKLIGSEIPDY